MRSFLQFTVFLAIIFFVVGEFFGGWYVGVPPQTSVFLYKKTTTATVSRRTQAARQFPFSVEGRLSRGTLVVEGLYERPESVQNPGRKAIAPKVYFTETFGAGERIDLAKVMKQGTGIYKLHFIYDDASGSLRIKVPPSSAL